MATGTAPHRTRCPKPSGPRQASSSYSTGAPSRGSGPGPACTLLAAIDDATEAALGGCFRGEGDAAGYLGLLREIARRAGLPAGVYTDRHGIVRNDEHWSLAEELAGAQAPTQVGHALRPQPPF